MSYKTNRIESPRFETDNTRFRDDLLEDGIAKQLEIKRKSAFSTSLIVIAAAFTVIVLLVLIFQLTKK